MYNIHLRPYARQNLVQIARYYEDQDQGLGLRFLETFQALEGSMGSFPFMFAEYEHGHPDLGIIFRAKLGGFPVAAYYTVSVPGTLDVIAIIHTSQDIDDALSDIG